MTCFIHCSKCSLSIFLPSGQKAETNNFMNLSISREYRLQNILNIHDFNKSRDVGEYKCIASDTKETKTAKVTFVANPRLNVSTENSIVRVVLNDDPTSHTKATIRFPFDANPVPRFEWFGHNMLQFSVNSMSRIFDNRVYFAKVSDKEFYVQFKTISLDRSSNYTLVVTSICGTENRTVEIIVSGKKYFHRINFLKILS